MIHFLLRRNTIHSNWPWLGWLFFVFFFCLSACTANSNPTEPKNTGPVVITVSETPLVHNIKRFGINLTEHTYWGSGQIMKNLVGLNPGFEGWTYQSIVEVVAGGSDRFLIGGARWDTGFWDGASFEVIWGNAKGRKGEIRAFQNDRSKKAQPQYFCAVEGLSFEEGDQVILRQSRAGDADGNWWVEKNGNGQVSSEINQSRPGSRGGQSLALRAPDPTDRAAVHSYFDTLKEGGEPFLPLHGSYRLTFWAKALSPDAAVTVSFKRLTRDVFWFNQPLSLTSSWQRYERILDVRDDAGVGTLDLAFTAQGASLLLDDVSFSSVADTNPTVFRDPLVDALKLLSPGILRHWAGQLGDSLENQIADPEARRRGGYSLWSSSPKWVAYGTPEFLNLCLEVGSEPWLVVPITFTEREMAGLIQYLAGSPDSPYGRLRAESGRIRPWSEAFSTIHLEFGNEAWNAVFQGGAIENPRVYGQRADVLFAAARASDAYLEDRFNLILGGQAVNTYRNAEILAQGHHHDGFGLAPYLMSEGLGTEDMNYHFAKLFQEAQTVSYDGTMRENFNLTETAPHTSEIAIYEVNLHTTRGDISEESLAKLTPSAGAGVAVSLHMFNMLKRLRAINQCFYNLKQFRYNRGDGKLVKLWGAVRDLGSRQLKRPSFYHLQMCNQALIGDMVTTEHQGSGAAYLASSSGLPDIALDETLVSFAFRNAGEWALVVFNLHPVASASLILKLPPGKISQARKIYLSHDSLTDHNEDGETVQLAEEPLQLVSGYEDTLPPGSMTLWLWKVNAPQPVPWQPIK